MFFPLIGTWFSYNLVVITICLFLSAAMSGVSELSVQDVKETSVTLVWTPPPIQYESYQLTFTSQVPHGRTLTCGSAS